MYTESVLAKCVSRHVGVSMGTMICSLMPGSADAGADADAMDRLLLLLLLLQCLLLSLWLHLGSDALMLQLSCCCCCKNLLMLWKLVQDTTCNS